VEFWLRLYLLFIAQIILKVHEYNKSDSIDLLEAGYPPFTNDEVFREILEQAENFKKNRVEIRPYSVDAAGDSRMVAER
jgi:hypothetical protein